MTIRVLGVVAVFGLGVGIGCAAAPLLVLKASVQQAATLTKWEYACIDTMYVTTLNPYGAQGWELAATTVDPSNGSVDVCLKPPKM